MIQDLCRREPERRECTAPAKPLSIHLTNQLFSSSQDFLKVESKAKSSVGDWIYGCEQFMEHAEQTVWLK